MHKWFSIADRPLKEKFLYLPTDMGENKTYGVEIESGFAGFWRYNIAVTCGLFDETDRQIGFVPAESTVAPVGSNLDRCPSDMPAHRRLSFTAADCDHLLMYIYIIPHTLPTAKHTGECKPFDLSVKVAYAGRVVLHEKRKINQWSGASMEIAVSRSAEAPKRTV